MDMCPAVPPGSGFIGSMTGYIDCQAQVLGSGTWSALAAPGSTLSVVLTGFLTITIALIGYNLLLGHSLTVRSGTLAAVKIGAIFALATSWPAYRTLVYDLVTDGPSQLVAEIGPQAGVVGSDGTLVQRLDLADQALAQLAILGPGNPPPNTGTQIPPAPFGGFDAFALGGSRILFELTAIAGLGIVRIIAGLMLALGPFFIAFLMFDSTRSLFEGWVRVLGGAGLAAIGVSIALGLELALLEPWLSDVLARRMGGEALPTVSTELFVIACLFTMIVAAALYACARVTRAFRLAPLLKVLPVATEQGRAGASPVLAANTASRELADVERSRAASVASAFVSMNRRELRDLTLSAPSGVAAPGRTPALSSSNDSAARAAMPVPVGRSFTRHPHARVSATSARRDAGA
ncbi:MAG TPA: type IV secretion system protein [Sphingomicrobium sp.]|nr:type IV secretion system protein [Sphingomicrobium sp.]